jgi:hypothetical protein
MTKPWPHLDATIVSRGYLLQAMNEMRFAEGGNLPADIAASQLGPASEHIIRMITGGDFNLKGRKFDLLATAGPIEVKGATVCYDGSATYPSLEGKLPGVIAIGLVEWVVDDPAPIAASIIPKSAFKRLHFMGDGGLRVCKGYQNREVFNEFQVDLEPIMKKLQNFLIEV